MQGVRAGTPVEQVDTPAMLVDIDAMDRNIAHIAWTLREHGVNWRPHAKGHKTLAVAHRQLAAGAIGVTCAKLGEAEIFANAGIHDILIANQIVGPIKTDRLAALVAATKANIKVAVDDIANARDLDAAAARYGVTLPVVIEIETGMNRSGVPAGDAVVELAREITALPHLHFAGVMSWEGHAVAVADHAQRRETVTEAVSTLVASAEACRAAGIPVEIVSCGGSGTYLTSGSMPGVTEVQAGGATLGDFFYRELESPVESALTLMAQVVSRPTDTRVILDCGRKTIDPSLRTPTPRDLGSVAGMSFSAEHLILTLAHPSETPRPGDRVYFDIGYHDQALHLHEELFAVRDGVVVAIWPTATRGKLQ